MLQIIGFEGYAGDEVVCTYGAAAASDGVTLYNLVSGMKCSIEEWEKLVKNRAATPVTPHAPTTYACGRGSHPRGDFAALPCFVLRARRNSHCARLFHTFWDVRCACLESWKDENWEYWLWPDFESLQNFIRPMALKMREAIKEFQAVVPILDPWDGKTQEEYVADLKASSPR
jgi:hypothetical protein